MRKLLLTAALLLTTTTANAQYVYTHIPSHWLLDKGPRIVNVPQPMTEADLAAQNERHEKWLAFCKPVRNVDDFGVTRLSYAVKGCEYGRTE